MLHIEDGAGSAGMVPADIAGFYGANPTLIRSISSKLSEVVGFDERDKTYQIIHRPSYRTEI